MNFFHPVFVNVVDYLLWKVLGTVIINLQHFTLKAIVSSLHKTNTSDIQYIRYFVELRNVSNNFHTQRNLKFYSRSWCI